MNYNEILPHIELGDYSINFWNAMKGKLANSDKLKKGRVSSSGTYALPTANKEKYIAAIRKHSVFHKIATTIKVYGSDYRIFAKDSKDIAAWVPEGEEIPFCNAEKDFDVKNVESHKLAILVKTDEDFINDMSFNFENYLIGKLGKCFARAEDNAFINGTGVRTPAGILDSNNGANIGVTTTEVTYDDVIRLYFSVEPEYRTNGVWLMNDKTACMLRTLKDDAGNYLWNSVYNTILGKEVVISEFMPDIGEGEKPIAFGDFSYYWIVIRKPLSVRAIKENFIVYNQIGHLAVEFLDGKLIRPDAIKVMEISSATV